MLDRFQTRTTLSSVLFLSITSNKKKLHISFSMSKFQDVFDEKKIVAAHSKHSMHTMLSVLDIQWAQWRESWRVTRVNMATGEASCK